LRTFWLILLFLLFLIVAFLAFTWAYEQRRSRPIVTTSITTTTLQTSRNIFAVQCFTKVALRNKIGIKKAEMEFRDQQYAKHLCGSVACNSKNACKFVPIIFVDREEKSNDVSQVSKGKD